MRWLHSQLPRHLSALRMRRAPGRAAVRNHVAVTPAACMSSTYDLALHLLLASSLRLVCLTLPYDCCATVPSKARAPLFWLSATPSIVIQGRVSSTSSCNPSHVLSLQITHKPSMFSLVSPPCFRYNYQYGRDIWRSENPSFGKDGASCLRHCQYIHPAITRQNNKKSTRHELFPIKENRRLALVTASLTTRPTFG